MNPTTITASRHKRYGDRAASRINALSHEGRSGTLRINSQTGSVVLSHGHQRWLFRGVRERRPARSSLSRTAVHASGFLSRATPSPPAFQPPCSSFSLQLHPTLSLLLSLSPSLLLSLSASYPRAGCNRRLSHSLPDLVPLFLLVSSAPRLLCRRRRERARIHARGAALLSRRLRHFGGRSTPFPIISA